MNFTLSEQQSALQDSLSRLIEEACNIRRVHAVMDKNPGIGQAGYDTELWQHLVAFGAAGTCIAEEYGGLGLEMIDLALIAEVIGNKAAPVPFLGHALAGLAISKAGSVAQKKDWLPKLASGEVLATVAFGEGGGAWLPEQWTLATGAAGAALKGEKINVPNAGDAGLIVVGLAGGALGLVRNNAGSGIEIEPLDGVDRTRRIDVVHFKNSKVDLLPDGVAQAGAICDAALVLLAADAFGGATRCVDMAVAYAKEREQFGMKIAQFQALRHQLANMAIETEPMRGLYWYAAHAYDHIRDKASYAAAMAKSHLTDRYQQVARDAVEAHGGIGYTWEYDAHIFLKRALFDFAWMGAPTVHRLRAADLAGW